MTDARADEQEHDPNEDRDDDYLESRGGGFGRIDPYAGAPLGSPYSDD